MTASSNRPAIAGLAIAIAITAALLRRAGHSEVMVLCLTTAGFVLWHVPAISLDTGFDVPASEIPVNAAAVFLLALRWRRRANAHAPEPALSAAKG